MKTISLTIAGVLLSLSLNSCRPQDYSRGQLKIIPGSGKNIENVSAEPLGAEPRIVRVGLRENAKEASIECEGPIGVTDLDLKVIGEWRPGKYMLTSKNGYVLLNGQKKGKRLRLKSLKADQFLKSNSSPYRGTFIIQPGEGDTVNIIGEMDMDEYLRGVLPREVVVTWPEATLRAQAVASRTYVASHLGRHKKSGFDVCTEVHCQVFGGVAREHPRTNKAVADTRGEILTYKQKPISAFFHSNSGGATEGVNSVWGSPNKVYLPQKRDPYGAIDPKYTWNKTVKNRQILESLKNKGLVQGKKIKNISVKMKSGSGRAARIAVQTDKGTYEMSGSAFRMAVGPSVIRSTLWTRVKSGGESTHFAGRGWGHGIGMSQWGARGMAEKGKSYREILSFYYPQTKIDTW